MHSADELEKCVRVTPPSVWVALVAFAVLLAGILAWAIFGTIATVVPTKGVILDGQAMCLLSEEDVQKMHLGDQAKVGDVTLTVNTISTIPISRAEAGIIAPLDYLVNALMKDDWAYVVTFEGDVSKLPEGVPLSMEVTVQRLAPIDLVLRR